MLVHHHPSVAGRGDHRFRWHGGAGDRWCGFGFHFGAAFQIRDDLLNLVGDERVVRQGDPRRHLRGQADAAARAPARHREGRRLATSRDYLRRGRAERSPELVARCGPHGRPTAASTFTSEYAEGHSAVAEEYFEQAFADAEPGPDLDFLRALVPYVWARWR